MSHDVLRRYGSVEALLARMADDHTQGWVDRESLTRTFIAEHQRDAGNGFWSTLLLLAYFPMLSTSAEHRHISLVADIPADLPAPAPTDPSPPSALGDLEQTVAQLLDIAGQELPPEQLEVLVATVLQKERLRSYAGRDLSLATGCGQR